ncbi:MAG: acyl-CoA dehydrogenase family protein [Aquisalinus sp.]|nr:acyl-CoA dehydrogenase family protein [Aquisalinus sp.]
MDLELTKSDRAFREEVRDFLQQAIPDTLQDKVLSGKEITRSDHDLWFKILYEKGWIAPSWPKALGGTGWSLTQRYIFDQELSRTPAPLIMPFSIRMLGPVLLEFGTNEQKERFIPGILDGSTFWCQGFSEPGAGSDLASLRTSAVRDGDDYVVNGQKIWTSYAHWADWMFALVRTSSEGRPQEGISFLLIDMSSPGIEVRPIMTIDGHHHLNEVFFNDVRVPVGNRIGEENKGWACAKFLLGHERTGLTGVAETQNLLQHLRIFAETRQTPYGPLSETPSFKRKLTLLETRLKALEITELQCLAREEQTGHVGPEASILKMVGTKLQQEVSEAAVEAMGEYANAHAPGSQLENANEESIGPGFITKTLTLFFFRRAATIYGGSDEVQRNVIAKHVLGL